MTLPLWIVALATVFVVAWLVQMAMHVAVWQVVMRRARRQKAEAARRIDTTTGSTERPGVSVLVYTKNEAEALARNLPVLLSQDYPTYEVIVLDDNSYDETQDVLQMMDQRSDRLLHAKIGERTRAMSLRKLAVLLGTKMAHYDIILTTHAQCAPNSPDWISGMMSHFANPGVEVVVGPVVYERRTSLVARFCQFDLFQRLLLMLDIALTSRAYAGWGQNLAFRKSTFYANRSQGFQRHLKMQPGEDDLFVADVARDGNVAVECRPDSVVTNQSRPLFVNWSMDRLNRGYTSRLYPWSAVVVKGVDYATRYLTVIPGLALAGYALMRGLAEQGAAAQTWGMLLGAVVTLLLLRVGMLLLTFVGSARALKQSAFVGWPIVCDLYTPLVDLWFRIKALANSKRFAVGKVGLQ